MPETKSLGFQSVPALAIALPEEAIASFCKQWKIKEFYLFGSILRNDFHSGSDVDVLIELLPTAAWGLSEAIAMKESLENIFSRKVDLIRKGSIEKSRNWIRREEILSTARLIYATK